MFTAIIFFDTNTEIISIIGNNTIKNGNANDAMAGIDLNNDGGNIPP